MRCQYRTSARRWCMIVVSDYRGFRIDVETVAAADERDWREREEHWGRAAHQIYPFAFTRSRAIDLLGFDSAYQFPQGAAYTDKIPRVQSLPSCRLTSD